MEQIAERLTGKIQKLSNDQLVEVERFVERLQAWEQDRAKRVRGPRSAAALLKRDGTILKTTFTMPYDFGDVVLVRFPFKTQLQNRKFLFVIFRPRDRNAIHSCDSRC
jgi:hypothetical protein